MKLLFRIALAAFALCLGVQDMAASNDSVLKASSVSVTLEAFSGRPDPTWLLTPAMTAELLQRLRALQAADDEPKSSDRLGYRGIRAELCEDEVNTTVLVVSHGHATLERQGQRAHYSDSRRELESWLVRTGASHLSADLVGYVMKEIETTR